MQRIEDMFKIHYTLGSGGFGRVFVVSKILKKNFFRTKTDHKLYTLKVLKSGEKSLGREAALLKRASVLKQATQILNYYKNVTYKGVETEAILLKYIPGITLDDYFIGKPNEIRYSERFMKSFILNLLRLVEKHHAIGIIHRDIKPRNIVIHKNKLRMIDYGLSCIENDSYSCSGINGTHGYIAPEVYSRKSNIDWKKTDLWSVGSLLLRLYYKGKPNLTKEAVKEKLYSIESEKVIGVDYIKFVILNLLNKDPARRLPISVLKDILKGGYVPLQYINMNEIKTQPQFIYPQILQPQIGQPQFIYPQIL